MTSGALHWLLLLAAGALSLGTAVFYRALRSASPARLEELNQKRRAYAKLPDMDEALVFTGWLKVVVYAGFGTSVALLFFADRGVDVVSYLATIGVSAGVLLACEALALVTAGWHSGSLIYRMLPAVAVLAAAGNAVLTAGGAIAWLVARMAGREAPPPPEREAEVEMLDALTLGEREGIIRGQEREMIESIIEFRDVEVSKILTPRTEVATVNAAMTLSEALEVAIRSGHSRMPVFAENADNIIGVLHVKDALQYAGSKNDLAGPVREIMRAPYFVPETKRVRELLREFQATNVHLAIVLDEYGGTSGIVTIEDILEEIVGEIEDEYDLYEPPPVRVTGPGRGIVLGQAGVREVNDALDLNLPETDEYETVAGYVLFHLGRIPRTGETFDLQGVRFRVFDAEPRRIRRMAVESAKEPAAPRKETVK